MKEVYITPIVKEVGVHSRLILCVSNETSGSANTENLTETSFGW